MICKCFIVWLCFIGVALFCVQIMFLLCYFFFVSVCLFSFFFFFFQAEDGIRDADVTGVQTCALPIFFPAAVAAPAGSTATRTAAGSGGHFLPCRFAGVRWRPCGPAAAAGRDGGYRLGGCGNVSGWLRGNPGSTRPTVHLCGLSGRCDGYRPAGLAERPVLPGRGVSAVVSAGDRGDAILGSVAT